MNVYASAVQANTNSRVDIEHVIEKLYTGRKVAGKLASGRVVTGTIFASSNAGFNGIIIHIQTADGVRILQAKAARFAC